MLVNNAANFCAGYFEELTPKQIERQLATSLIDPMNVTRAVLPIMRKQRSGHVISISSGAGLMGFEFNSAYCAGKFGLEGWTEALQPEVAPFGIHTTILNPGFFRTELLTQESTTYAEASIADLRRATRRPTGMIDWLNRLARILWFAGMTMSATRIREHFPDGVDRLADGAVLIEVVVPAVRDGGAFTSVRGF